LNLIEFKKTHCLKQLITGCILPTQMKTQEQVKVEFSEAGLSIRQWSIENGFAPSLVYRVLSLKKIPLRGESHNIAVLLGIKKGQLSDVGVVAQSADSLADLVSS